MTGIKRWCRVVFDPELDRLGSRLARNFSSNGESKIDAGGNTTRGDYVAGAISSGVHIARLKQFSGHASLKSLEEYIELDQLAKSSAEGYPLTRGWGRRRNWAVEFATS